MVLPSLGYMVLKQRALIEQLKLLIDHCIEDILTDYLVSIYRMWRYIYV